MSSITYTPTDVRVTAALQAISIRREHTTEAVLGKAMWRQYGATVWREGESYRSSHRPVHDPAPGWTIRDAVLLSTHITENDPRHVLAVLQAHEDLLLRHRHGPIDTPDLDRLHETPAPTVQADGCQGCLWRDWPCPDVRPVLNLYAPVSH